MNCKNEREKLRDGIIDAVKDNDSERAFFGENRETNIITIKVKEKDEENPAEYIKYKMKYIIKGILKEDFVNKKKEQEYLDFIVNEMLSGDKITDHHSFDIPSFKSLREFVDMYGDEE